MHDGEIVEIGSTAQIIDSANVEYTKGLIGANPSIPEAGELKRLAGARFRNVRGA